MRVTQSSMSRNYLKSMNYNLNNMNESYNRLMTGKALEKVSDNPADAAKAFAVREQMYKIEQAISGLEDAYGEMSAAEDAMMSTNAAMQTVMEKLTQLSNGTYDDNQRDITATEIESLRDQMLQLANSKYGTKNLFGGTNNDGAPFAIDDNGVVTYNGSPVDELVPYDPTMTLSADTTLFPENFSPKNGMAMREVPAGSGEYAPVDKNSEVYIDANFGLSFTASGAVESTSAVQLSFNGTDFFGFGTNDDGVPMNIISFVSEVADAMRDNDVDRMNSYIDIAKDVHSELTTDIAEIGGRTNFLETTVDRYESSLVTLKESQNNLESINFEEEAINMEMYERAWMVSLQLGSRILPTSLFDFMG